MTAVICWSMKISMVARIAGKILSRMSHHGFLSLSGLIIQGLSGRVGYNKNQVFEI